MAKEPNKYLLSDKAQAVLNLARTKGEYTSAEISDMLGADFLSKRASVGVVNSLVKKGLVTRELRTDDDGSEIKVVVPTKLGSEFDLKTVNPKHDEWVKAEAAKAKEDADVDDDLGF